MKRIFFTACVPILLCPLRTSADSPRYAVLTFDDGPSGRFTRRLPDGLAQRDVILLHDMTDSSVDAALEIIDRLREKGFSFVTAAESVRLRRIRLTLGTVYDAFPLAQVQEKGG